MPRRKMRTKGASVSFPPQVGSYPHTMSAEQARPVARDDQ